jgi:hypothetical protein
MTYAALEGVIVTLVVIAAMAYALWRWRPGKKKAGCDAGCGSCKGCGSQPNATPNKEQPVNFHR